MSAVRRHWLVLTAVAVTLALVAGAACQKAPQQAKYPSKPIEFVVPFNPGGGSDILARNIVAVIEAEKLLPQPVQVVNKAGGSGAVGYGYLAEKKGDPYFIGTVSSSFWTTPLLGGAPFNYTMFTPVAGLCYDTYLLLVRQDSPYQTLQDVLKAVKDKPEGLTVGATGVSSDDRVVTYLLEKAAGVKFKLVPFQSGGEVMTALLGGHIDVAWANPGEARGQLEGKQARALAVAADQRLEGLPDVPTFKEQGIDLVFRQLRGVVMPAGVPEDAVKVMEETLKKVSESPKWKNDYVKKNDLVPTFLGSAEFKTAIEKMNETYKQVFEELGVLKK